MIAAAPMCDLPAAGRPVTLVWVKRVWGVRGAGLPAAHESII
jgi:hypothetical protein